jgi:F0F1-type ATP synthase assembly protein I
MLILLFLGFVAGFINIIRVSSNSPGKRSGGEDKG